MLSLIYNIIPRCPRVSRRESHQEPPSVTMLCSTDEAPAVACDAMGCSMESLPQTSHRIKRKPEEMNGDDVCFICLDGGALSQPCACPRLVHEKCMARWQLQQAGRREERFCRFCHNELPDWKDALAPSSLTPAEPIMVVTLGNEVHRIKVKPGPEGMQEFQIKIRSLFNIPEDVEFEVTFRCKTPVDDSGRVPVDTIQLEGMDSYEAATHCASLMAAQRLAAGGSPVFLE